MQGGLTFAQGCGSPGSQLAAPHWGRRAEGDAQPVMHMGQLLLTVSVDRDGGPAPCCCPQEPEESPRPFTDLTQVKPDPGPHHSMFGPSRMKQSWSWLKVESSQGKKRLAWEQGVGLSNESSASMSVGFWKLWEFHHLTDF